jgi:hypothetical protein
MRQEADVRAVDCRRLAPVTAVFHRRKSYSRRTWPDLVQVRPVTIEGCRWTSKFSCKFFQAAATALPTIFIAFSITSHLLDPVSRRNLTIHFVLLSGKSGIVTLAILVIGFIASELMTLIVLATDTPAFPVFVVVIFLFFFLPGLLAFRH